MIISHSMKGWEYWNENIFRFANIFHLNAVNISNKQSVVKMVKSRASLDCDNTMLTNEGMLSLMKEVEQILQIESSEQINETLTNEELRPAAEMFLYLIMCPNTIRKPIKKCGKSHTRGVPFRV